jgi:putative SOS response-associated peptidase YedK
VTGNTFTLLTTAPGPDVAPIRGRQMIVLERDDRAVWLDLTKPEGDAASTAGCPSIARRTGQVDRTKEPTIIRQRASNLTLAHNSGH